MNFRAFYSCGEEGRKAIQSALLLGEGSRHRSVIPCHRWPTAYSVAPKKGIKVTSGLLRSSSVSVKGSLRKNLRECSWEPWLFGQPLDWLGIQCGGRKRHPEEVLQDFPDSKPKLRSKAKQLLNTGSLYLFVAHLHSNIFTLKQLLNRNKNQKYHMKLTEFLQRCGQRHQDMKACLILGPSRTSSCGHSCQSK